MVKKRRKKQPFLLMEVLLAIAVIGLCAYPLLAPHFMMANAEMVSLQQRKLERAADQAFIKLVQYLHENAIPTQGRLEKVNWKSFDETILGTFPEPVLISINKGKPVKFLSNYEIKRVIEGEEDSMNFDQFRLLEIRLGFIKEGADDFFTEYAYRVSIEREKESQ